MTFDITPMVSEIGASSRGLSLSGYAITTNSRNEQGDITKTKTTFAIDGIPFIMSTEEDEVKAGYLQPGDLLLLVSDTETNTSKLKNGNELLYDGALYRIKNVVPIIGHFEVFAKKI